MTVIFKILKARTIQVVFFPADDKTAPWTIKDYTEDPKNCTLSYISTHIWSKIMFLEPLFVKDRFTCKQNKKFGIAGKAVCLLECLSAISAKIQFIFTPFARNFIF
jgi:hypothetical protein